MINALTNDGAPLKIQGTRPIFIPPGWGVCQQHFLISTMRTRLFSRFPRLCSLYSRFRFLILERILWILDRFTGYVRRCADDYGMLERGDRVAVGVSGGKDSMALLAALHRLRRYHPSRLRAGGRHHRHGLSGHGLCPRRRLVRGARAALHNYKDRHTRDSLRRARGRQPLFALLKDAPRRAQRRHQGARLQQARPRPSL